MLRLALVSATCLLFCTFQSTARIADPVSATPPLATKTEHGFGPEVSTEDISMHIKVLASDEFGGRA